eukprot:TRINITY_DN261_c0_g1_i10.p1 TRINITY_DN261_c0_g1~~TRINITY_DN261_c0_g1_i10.p1  ORF type:complete len:776 (-),score=93.57 TRINITY_DN261_c0_g1_i10:6343-8670(-)
MDPEPSTNTDRQKTEEKNPFPFTFASQNGSITLPLGKLPSSFLSLVPKILPSAMIIVLPQRALTELKFNHGQNVTVNNRLAKLFSADVLLSNEESNGPDNDVIPIALFSPCLHCALTRDQDVVKTFVLKDTELPLLESVVLHSILPNPLPSHQASRIAALAKRSLIGRDVRSGDILPMSVNVWLEVQKVAGGGIIGKDTSVAISLGSRSSRTLNESHEDMRAWARAKWIETVPWPLDPFADMLATALDKRARVIFLEGLDRDVEDLLRTVFVGRVVKWVRYGTSEDLKEAIARCELAGGGAVVVQHVDDDMKSIISAKLAQGEGNWIYSLPIEEQISFVVCSEYRDDVDLEILQSIDIDIVVPKASEDDRRKILKQAIASTDRGLSTCEIEELVRLSTGFSRREAYELGKLFIRKGVETCRKMVTYFEKGMLSVDSGGITWNDIGGLDEARKQILELVQAYDPLITMLPEKKGSQTAISNRRVGLLLYGPPGTGKTLLARAVANECGCSFIAVKGPELLDMYVGESEKNVREVFQRAIVAAPCVIFFDELDALAPNRGRGSDSGGVSDRVVSQLLAELDLISSRSDIFVIAATNRPDLIDSGLLRPGRLDKLVYVQMPRFREDQVKILKAQTAKFSFADDVDLSKALSHAPEPPLLSGADIYAIASSAWMSAAKRAAAKAEAESTNDNWDCASSEGTPNGTEMYEMYRDWFSGEGQGHEDSRTEKSTTVQPRKRQQPVIVVQNDLVTAAESLQPSLSLPQIHEYDELRRSLESGI